MRLKPSRVAFDCLTGDVSFLAALHPAAPACTARELEPKIRQHGADDHFRVSEKFTLNLFDVLPNPKL